jgi:hypothetical protein
MGLLDKYSAVPDPMPVRQTATVAPAPVVHEVPAPVPTVRNRTLTPVRNAQGRIESVTGFNAAGEKVTFEFERNGRQSLERIKVK